MRKRCVHNKIQTILEVHSIVGIDFDNYTAIILKHADDLCNSFVMALEDIFIRSNIKKIDYKYIKYLLTMILKVVYKPIMLEVHF